MISTQPKKNKYKFLPKNRFLRKFIIVAKKCDNSPYHVGLFYIKYNLPIGTFILSIVLFLQNKGTKYLDNLFYSFSTIFFPIIIYTFFELYSVMKANRYNVTNIKRKKIYLTIFNSKLT